MSDAPGGEAEGRPGDERGRPPGRVRRLLAAHPFIQHVLTLMTGTGVAQLLPIVTMPIITRLYSQEAVGAWVVVTSVAGFVIPLAALRYDLAIMLPKSDDDARRLVRIASRINLVMALVTTLVMLLFAPRIASLFRGMPEHAHAWLYGVGAIVWAFGQMAIYTQWLVRQKRFTLVSRNKMMQSSTVAVTQVGLGPTGVGAFGLVLGTLLGQVAALLNLWRRGGIPERVALTSDDVRRLLREHRKMPLLNGPNALVDAVRLQGINLFIGAIAGAAVVGQFGLAWMLVQAPTALVASALSQVFFQRLSVTPRGEMSALVRRSLRTTLLVAAVPFLLIYLLAPPVLPWVLGADWTRVGLFAAALTPWLYLNFSTAPISNLFVVARRQGIMLAFAVVYAALPLTIIWSGRGGDLLRTVWWMSLGQAALLVVLCAVALLVARGYDRGAASDSA